MDDYLLIGKTRASLTELDGEPVRDAYFVNEDGTDLEIRNKTVKSSVWVNMPLKGAKFVKCDFSYTTFLN